MNYPPYTALSIRFKHRSDLVWLSQIAIARIDFGTFALGVRWMSWQFTLGQLGYPDESGRIGVMVVVE